MSNCFVIFLFSWSAADSCACRYMPASPDYFTHVQREIRPHMRFTVTEWMFEICMDERLQFSSSPEVFALAVNFLDRFLSLCW